MKSLLAHISARRIPLIVLLAITLLTVQQYRGIFNVTFMSDDTMDFIQGTSIVKHEVWYPFVGKGMWRDGPQYYRPLPVISHGLDAVIFGYWPAAHRAMQLALHLACCFAAYALYRSWLGKNGEAAAAVAVLVFVLHPIHEYAMWWPGGSRNDVMCGTFYVLTALAFTAYAREHKPRSLILAALSTAAALMCKEMAYSLPLICFVIYLVFAPVQSSFSQRLKPAVVAILPLVAVAALFMLYRLVRFDLGSTLLGVQFGPSHFVASLHAAARGLLFPFDVSFRDAFRDHMVLVIAAVVVLVALASTRIRQLKSPVVLLGLTWIALSLLPMLRTISPWGLYITSIGFCLLVGQIFTPDRTRSGVASAVILAVLVVSYQAQWEHRRTVWGELNAVADRCMSKLRADYQQDPFKRALFLDMPGSIGDAPLYMNYFTDRLQFEMPGDTPEVIVLSIGIFPAGTERQAVTIDTLPEGGWKVTLTSDKARFAFSEHPRALYRFDSGDIGDVFQYRWGTAEVVAEHLNGQPSAVIVRLSKEYETWYRARCYYFSEGELHQLAAP